MSFYFKPPRGEIHAEKLLMLGQQRLEILTALRADSALDEVISANLESASESVLEGSSKDRVAHFVLKLAAVKNRSFREFFVAKEQILFAKRLELKSSCVRKALLELRRHLKAEMGTGGMVGC